MVVAALAGALFFPRAARADTEGVSAPNRERPIVLVETDPATFAFSGYAAHVRVAPGGSGWTLGAGVYGQSIPSFVTELGAGNRGGDWTLDLRNGYGLFVDRHFAGTPRGPFVGAQLALQRWELGREATSEIHEYGTLLVMGRFGTLWHPFESGFYIEPWVGVGPSVKIYGSTTIGDRHYTPLPVLAFGAVHVGWTI
jgi:hypothetical protein